MDACDRCWPRDVRREEGCLQGHDDRNRRLCGRETPTVKQRLASETRESRKLETGVNAAVGLSQIYG